MILAFSVAQFWHFSAATLRTAESVKHPINHTKYFPPNSFTAHNNLTTEMSPFNKKRSYFRKKHTQNGPLWKEN